jgi:hypothetical protein
MVKLAMTSLDTDLEPAIGLEYIDEIFDFHLVSPVATGAIAARRQFGGSMMMVLGTG